MILADKIIKHRKKNGWSQEELAERLNVSPQLVSAWEAAQTIPDIENVIQMAELFGVTTDYLLKDGVECEEFTEDIEDVPSSRPTIDDAKEYLQQRKDL